MIELGLKAVFILRSQIEIGKIGQIQQYEPILELMNFPHLLYWRACDWLAYTFMGINQVNFFLKAEVR